jgi:mannose-6-phosphate isomerase-like protein (cupin superfamily)
MAGYAVAARGDAVDWMADYAGFGEMRWYTEALGAEGVSFSWRLMPPGTGGKGSYGHRHPGHEEIYFVISGTPTFKVGDEVFDAAPKTAVRMTGEDFYSVHNGGDGDVELLIFNARDPDMPSERREGFWPE